MEHFDVMGICKFHTLVLNWLFRHFQIIASFDSFLISNMRMNKLYWGNLLYLVHNFSKIQLNCGIENFLLKVLCNFFFYIYLPLPHARVWFQKKRNNNDPCIPSNLLYILEIFLNILDNKHCVNNDSMCKIRRQMNFNKYLKKKNQNIFGYIFFYKLFF